LGQFLHGEGTGAVAGEAVGAADAGEVVDADEAADEDFDFETQSFLPPLSVT